MTDRNTLPRLSRQAASVLSRDEGISKRNLWLVLGVSIWQGRNQLVQSMEVVCTKSCLIFEKDTPSAEKVPGCKGTASFEIPSPELTRNHVKDLLHRSKPT